MRRANQESGDLPGQDSFLDIVANIVGILILLVMVVGLRAAHTERQSVQDPVAQTATANPVLTTESTVTAEQLEIAAQEVIQTREEVIGKAKKTLAAREEVALRDATRVELVAFVAKLEETLEAERRQMNADQQRSFDIRKKLGAAQQQLEELTREQIAIVSQEPEVKVIESLPTPLAAKVKGEELYVRLAGGRAKLIPRKALMREVEMDFAENRWRLEQADRMTRVVGPIDGFRLRYTFEKVSLAGPTGGMSYARAVLVEVLPTAEVLGEPIGEELTDESQLLNSILTLSRGRPVPVTVWTYPDSFDQYRAIKKSLYQRDYAVACRPLRHGQLIAGSPGGRASAAQ